ncbi:MAG: alpha-amylase family glycosyl hydrolase [Planctomycetia bacterium]|nr:alpha-amylase family glycosyl hydrolase [Planctomycetia bacterium]
MINRCFFLCVFSFFVLTVSLAQGSESAQTVDLKNDQVIFRFDAKSGRILSMDYKGKSIGNSMEEKQDFDLNLKGKWQWGKHPLVCKQVRKENQTVIVSQTFGDWDLDFHFQLDPRDPLLTCWIRITWNGDEEQRLEGFWWRPFSVAVDPESRFFSPGSWPPAQYIISDLKKNSIKRFGQITPSLIVEQNKNRSFLFICDDLYPNADSCQLAAGCLKDRLQTTVSFDIKARMKKGSKQEVGRYCFQIFDTDGEQALHQIHNWMKKFGHTIPGDRPNWFAGADLYSFHPGGTIGSNCKDLGGFSNSLPLLDRIQAMNMNAIWIMPIEDQSIYCPRDYYKFQPGLGSGEEYKKLVSRAHHLGLHVLQDCVPHGGRNTFPRAIEHPEWLVYDEDGKTLSYWCFDFNYPSWREYMARVARYYVKEYGVDGYRVDAVSGSKIPNWNPAIPYDRASFAKRQGGLNMLRALRGAVKSEKPAEGGLLAETSGSVFGAVSDAIYDFRGCYGIYHDLRKQEPALFVDHLRRYLHEEQYSEMEDLLRLRHSESHDSLRTQLWYGIEPGRAVVALTAFIYGIPLIYHEQEDGNFFVFQKLFGIKRRLPELQKGKPDYIGVDVPPGVFAVRRSLEEKESIALINFNPVPIDFSLNAGNQSVITDMINNAPAAVNSGSVPVHLDAYQYNVFALRDPKEIPDLPINKSEKKNREKRESADRISSQSSTNSEKKDPHLLVLANDKYRGEIDTRTGLLRSFAIDGKQVLGPADLFLPKGLEDPANKDLSFTSSLVKEGKVCTFRKKIGKSLLQIRYISQKETLRMESMWSGEEIPSDAVLSFSVPEAASWGVQTAEGFLSDEYRIRPEGGVPGTSSIYRRTQGSPILYDSMLCPMYPLSEKGSFLSARTVKGSACFFSFIDLPGRVRWASQLGDQKELTAMISWKSPEASSRLPLQWSLELGDKPIAKSLPKSEYSLIPMAGGWLFENEHYRLRLSRTGSIISLISKQDPQSKDLILEGGEIYTDYGFGEKGTHYSNANEVEAASRIEKIGEDLRLVFEGHIRGKGRFERLTPGIVCTAEYRLGKSPSFLMKCGVRSVGMITNAKVFLSFKASAPLADSWSFIKEGKEIAQGNNLEIKGRSKESRYLDQPDTVRLFHQKKTIFTLSDLQGKKPENIFLDRSNFFLSFCDGKPYSADYEGSWSGVCTVGEHSPSAFKREKESNSELNKKANTFLKNPGFEISNRLPLISILSGRQIEADIPEPVSWIIPSAGKILSNDHAPEGKNVLMLENRTGEYLLARQQLALPEGSRWKITAWIKGENIVQGNPSWKKGTLRWAVKRKNQFQYISSRSLLGTFDWQKVEILVDVEPGDSSCSLEVGLNGSLGKMWVDQISFEKL